jgi:hypothetical protein
MERLRISLNGQPINLGSMEAFAFRSMGPRVLVGIDTQSGHALTKATLGLIGLFGLFGLFGKP